MKRIHHYHADGNALGGIIHLPKSAFVHSQAGVSLSPSGGSASDRKGPFNFHDIVSCSCTESHATGSQNPATGAWSTLVTTSVNDLNIRNVLTADRVVAQISLEHPRDGYTPRVTFVGSQFVNVRIAGVAVKVIINDKILAPCEDYPSVPWSENEEFHETIRTQRRRVVERGPTPAWAVDLFTDKDPLDGFEDRNYYVCSLVDSIEGKIPGEACGNLVRIPDVGTFIFGEIIVDPCSFGLEMVRAELGSPVTGSVSAAHNKGNGSSYP